MPFAFVPSDLPAIIEQLKIGVSSFVPELVLSAVFFLMILADVVMNDKENKRSFIPTIALIGFMVTAWFVYKQHELPHGQIFLGMYAIDPFALFFKYLFLASGALAVMISLDSEELEDKNVKSIGEYYAILVAMVLGMFLMASASDMLMMYLALELVSLSSYILTGYLKGQVKSSEASLKYIIYGAVSSGLMIYGISILYGLTGQTNIYAIAQFLNANQVDSVTLLLSVLLIMGGFGYKIGAVPFHFWSPDVYEGAPTSVTAFLSVGSKAAGFAMLIRFFRVAVPNVPTGESLGVDWTSLLAVLAFSSMVLGNITAIWQSSIKRMLAYSSIAHAGYLLLGVLVADDAGTQAVMFYLTAYTVMNVGAFFVVVLIANKVGSDDVNDFRGLGKRMPIASAALTVFMISLTGLPGTVGFISKYMIFSSLLGKGSVFIGLAIVGVLTSAISLYYYFKVPLNLYLRESESGDETELVDGVFTNVIVVLLMAVTVLLGFYFMPLANLTRESVSIVNAMM
jgi:NADH-quinone oxidoreductase subunit N